MRSKFGLRQADSTPSPKRSSSARRPVLRRSHHSPAWRRGSESWEAANAPRSVTSARTEAMYAQCSPRQTRRLSWDFGLSTRSSRQRCIRQRNSGCSSTGKSEAAWPQYSNQLPCGPERLRSTAGSYGPRRLKGTRNWVRARTLTASSCTVPSWPITSSSCAFVLVGVCLTPTVAGRGALRPWAAMASQRASRLDS